MPMVQKRQGQLGLVGNDGQWYTLQELGIPAGKNTELSRGMNEQSWTGTWIASTDSRVPGDFGPGYKEEGGQMVPDIPEDFGIPKIQWDESTMGNINPTPMGTQPSWTQQGAQPSPMGQPQRGLQTRTQPLSMGQTSVVRQGMGAGTGRMEQPFYAPQGGQQPWNAPQGEQPPGFGDTPSGFPPFRGIDQPGIERGTGSFLDYLEYVNTVNSMLGAGEPMMFEEWLAQLQGGPPPSEGGAGGDELTPEQRAALGLGDTTVGGGGATEGYYGGTYEDALAAVQQLGVGWSVGWENGMYVPVRSGGGQQQQQWMAPGTPPTDQYNRTPTWNARTGSWDYPPDWGQDPDYQQWQQEQADRQYRAQLTAEGPMSWLKYHSYEGTQPMSREWMKPLMAQEYGWGQIGGEGGQAIPGWTAESAAGIPQLTRPSEQYWARMGPTAQQEYAGYRQARSGIRPEELMYRRQSRTAPAGRFGGFSRTR